MDAQRFPLIENQLNTDDGVDFIEVSVRLVCTKCGRPWSIKVKRQKDLESLSVYKPGWNKCIFCRFQETNNGHKAAIS